MLLAVFAADLNARAFLSLQTRTFIGGRQPQATEILNGFRRTLSGSTHEVWELKRNPWPVKQWLEFFPHCDRPDAIFEALELAVATVDFVSSHNSEFLYSVRQVRSADALNLLVGLVKFDPDIANQHDWYQALLAQNLLDALESVLLVSEGTIADRHAVDKAGHHFPEQIARTLSTSEGASECLKGILARHSDA